MLEYLTTDNAILAALAALGGSYLPWKKVLNLVAPKPSEPNAPDAPESPESLIDSLVNILKPKPDSPDAPLVDLINTLKPEPYKPTELKPGIPCTPKHECVNKLLDVIHMLGKKGDTKTADELAKLLPAVAKTCCKGDKK